MFASDQFRPVALFARNTAAGGLAACGHENAVAHAAHMPQGAQTYCGIPFDCGEGYIFLKEGTYALSFEPFAAKYVLFLHSSVTPEETAGEDGLVKHTRGPFPQGVDICEYRLTYEDGETVVVPIRSRLEISDMRTHWGCAALLAVPHMRPRAFQTVSEEISAGRMPERAWGGSQFRVESPGSQTPLQHWIYAFENPRPGKAVTGMEIIAGEGAVFLFALTAGDTEAHPLRYSRRRKAAFALEGDPKDPYGLIDIDLGNIISVLPQLDYQALRWESRQERQRPDKIEGRYIVEYAAHEDAVFYAGGKRLCAAAELREGAVCYVRPAERPVTLRVTDKAGKMVPVRVHAHGAAGEYLPPRTHHRVPNAHWLEDYGAELADGPHWSAYIDGQAEYLLPLGEVFFEVSKGFEIKPRRVRFDITESTDEVTVALERVIDWRAKGWVTADTHVHFLPPTTALLEGEAEGVNIVNLLATQWGELFTNVGDFDGMKELGSGEHIVRVGTENRQRVMGHISLLGYEGRMIFPLTTGGPDESALGDPLETTLTQWGKQCREQGGYVVMPHFPNPRLENAAAIVSGYVDAVEACGNFAISPYYLSDWYRYLNCGYHVAAVGGTDKMGAYVAVGAMRTYALVEGPLTYQSWKQACIDGRTFATSGPLIDMRVEGRPMGSRIDLPGPGRLAVTWEVASATIPVTAVELVVNGDTADGVTFDGLLGEKSGAFTVGAEGSVWIALRVRGKMAHTPEVIVAHTSAVFAIVEGKPLFSAPDAATIIDQIEGATAYVKTLATMAQEKEYKQVLAALAGAHRALHNRMHAQGHYHRHSAVDMHEGH